MDTLIAINNRIYDYDKFDDDSGMHRVYEVDVDEEGWLTATYIPNFISDEEFRNNKGINLTCKQWVGIIKQMLTHLHNLDDDKAEDAANDIVCRCFVSTGVPKFEGLNEYLKNYLNR